MACLVNLVGKDEGGGEFGGELDGKFGEGGGGELGEKSKYGARGVGGGGGLGEGGGSVGGGGLRDLASTMLWTLWCTGHVWPFRVRRSEVRTLYAAFHPR